MPTTHWTQILEAGLDTPVGRACLESLIRNYHPSSVKFLRWLGADKDLAADLAQDYFLSLMTGAPLRDGTIRVSFGAFVVQGLRNVYRSHLNKQRLLKRGGGASHVQVEDDMLVDNPDLERAFHTLYVLHHVDLAKTEVEADYRAEGHGLRWDVLAPFLVEDPDYKAAAKQLGVSVALTQTWFARLKKRIRRKMDEFADQGSVAENAEAERARWQRTAMLSSEPGQPAEPDEPAEAKSDESDEPD